MYKIGLPWWLSGKDPPANAGDMGSVPGPEDPTCQGETKPMGHNYALEPGNCNCGSPHTLEPMLCNKRSHCSEKPMHRNWRKTCAKTLHSQK